jgi:cytochrome c oxidase assembly protein subunit 15
VLVWTGLVGLLVLGVSGAIAALGDTLFPVSSLAEGLRQDISETSHVLVRLRVWHPVLALSVGTLLVVMGAWLSRLRPSAEVKRSASLLGAAYGVQLGAGLVNLVLLAPVWMQLVHLLLADVVWILVVRLGVAALAEDAPRADAKLEPAASVAGS